MGANVGTATLAMTADDSDLKNKLTGVHGLVKSAFGDAAGFIGNALSFATGGLVLKGIEGIGGALQGLGQDIIGEALAAERGQAQLNAVIASTGGVARVTAGDVMAYSDSLAAIIPVEDDTITGAQSMMLTFTKVGKNIFPDATQAALDMAFAMNNGVTPSAEEVSAKAMLVGKALNDPIAGLAALSRVGVKFTEEQKEQIKILMESGNVMGAQKIILGELGKEFGGSAVAAGQTFSGQMEITKNAIGNMKESIGTALLPALQQMAVTFGPVLATDGDRTAPNNAMAVYAITGVSGGTFAISNTGVITATTHTGEVVLCETSLT